MAPKKLDLEKQTIRLFRGDFEELQRRYPEIGANEAIRKILRMHITRLKEKDEMLGRKTISDMSDIVVDIS